MHKPQRQVLEFHGAADLGIGKEPAKLRNIALRISLLREELQELDQAAVRRQDPVDAIDGLVDLIYVAYGTAIEWGIDLEPFFDEVHRANMTKIGGPKREDGKQLKPYGWKPPDIAGILERLRQKGVLPESWSKVEDDRQLKPEGEEAINHPSHYASDAHEPIDVIEDWGLDFHLGNVVKYIARAGRKGSELTDLKKARWYLDRRIERASAEGGER